MITVYIITATHVCHSGYRWWTNHTPGHIIFTPISLPPPLNSTSTTSHFHVCHRGSYIIYFHLIFKYIQPHIFISYTCCILPLLCMYRCDGPHGLSILNEISFPFIINFMQEPTEEQWLHKVSASKMWVLFLSAYMLCLIHKWQAWRWRLNCNGVNAQI